MSITEAAVLEELKKVIDPELFVNIVDLGLIYKVDIEASESADSDSAADDSANESSEEAKPEEDNKLATDEGSSDSATSASKVDVAIEMTLTSPMCPAGPQLVGQTKEYVKAMDGVQEVEVNVVMDPPWTQDRMSDDARDQLNIW